MMKRGNAMKKGAAVVLAMILMMLWTGCSAGELEYDMNLGYGLDQVKAGDILFKVYHSNTEDHSWEEIASFPCDPEPGHFYDVTLEAQKGQITAILRDNTYTGSGDSAVYDGIDAASHEFHVDGFEGTLHGCQYFPIKNEAGEQLVRLYPISNEDFVSYLEDISLDEPYYDEEGETIDNILVTIVME